MARLLTEKQYAIYAGSCLTFMQFIAQLAGHAGYNKLFFVIALAAFLVNFAAAFWAFSVEEDGSWKIVVFKTVFYFTGILAPYSAVSVLVPLKFAWYPFAAICVILTLLKCFNMLTAALILAYGKVADATRRVLSYVTKVPAATAPTIDAPAPTGDALDRV